LTPEVNILVLIQEFYHQLKVFVGSDRKGSTKGATLEVRKGDIFGLGHFDPAIFYERDAHAVGNGFVFVVGDAVINSSNFIGRNSLGQSIGITEIQLGKMLGLFAGGQDKALAQIGAGHEGERKHHNNTSDDSQEAAGRAFGYEIEPLKSGRKYFGHRVTPRI
jgi:hypothetical protein